MLWLAIALYVCGLGVTAWWRCCDDDWDVLDWQVYAVVALWPLLGLLFFCLATTATTFLAYLRLRAALTRLGGAHE